MSYEWFDWKEPDYLRVFQLRLEALKRVRAEPAQLPLLKAYYKDHIPQFISDWGCTTDPRNVEVDLPVVIPFILFPRQVEWLDWLIESWRARRPGVTPKSRESGVSWLAVAAACAICTLYDDFSFGFGSRLERYVDDGTPKSLFWKARKFRETLPPEFNGGYNPKTDAPKMRMLFSETGSMITGDSGDQIGRGDRTGIYVVDESAHLEHPEEADQALSQTTNCRIDVSTAYGLGGPFHTKVTKWPRERVFTFHWRDDPRKDQAWYDKQVSELDPVTVAQEIDIDFAASVEGVLIPSAWAQACVGAAHKLGIAPSGAKTGALDVADEGHDNNAFCGAYGIEVQALEEWSGKGSDIFRTTQRAFECCDLFGTRDLRFDSDGLGAGVRGDSRVINEQRSEIDRRIRVEAFRGSAEVYRPEHEDVKGRKNKDYFGNLKAQSWWSLRLRCHRTYRAVVESSRDYDPDSLISFNPLLPQLSKLLLELSQPTYTVNQVGKIIVDKAPDGALSPNLADVVMIKYASVKTPLAIPTDLLTRLAGRR